MMRLLRLFRRQRQRIAIRRLLQALADRRRRTDLWYYGPDGRPKD